MIPGGSKKNLEFLTNDLYFDATIKDFQKLIFSDAQTSGGLLISCPKKHANALLEELNKKSVLKSSIIGEFISKKDYNIFCK